MKSRCFFSISIYDHTLGLQGLQVKSKLERKWKNLKTIIVGEATSTIYSNPITEDIIYRSLTSCEQQLRGVA